MPKERGFLYRLFNDLYEVEIVFADGNSQKFYLREVKKLNKQFLKGIEEDGSLVEIATIEPFNYMKKKLY